MTWWHRMFRRGRMEQQLERELSFHLEQHISELIARGRDPQQARREARLSFGGDAQVKEECRDARGTRWLDDLWQDLRYAVRTLRRGPGFAAVAFCTLALGTGATTVMFTVIRGVLLKPLPFPEPDRLVKLYEQSERTIASNGLGPFAYLNFVDCRRESRSFGLMAALKYAGGTVSDPGDAQYVDGYQISSDLFSTLGVRLLKGRAFLEGEDRRGGAPVTIISHGLWQRRFGGSDSALGRTLVFQGRSYTIVGIVPPDFSFPFAADVYTPLGQNWELGMANRKAHPFIEVIARLRPGATLEQAQAELALIARSLAAQYPESNAGRSIVAEPLRPDVGDVRATLWLLLGAVSLVLLIACANVASLLLARAVSREREVAMRVSLGATRGRLMRQCLTESGVLALGGGALGVLLAAVGLRQFVAFWPGSLPRAEEVRLDWQVLLFTLAASALCGILFGLAPALRVPVRSLDVTLRTGARSIAGGARLRAVFVMSEITVAVVLLVSAGMLGRTLLRLASLDPGLNVRNVLTARVGVSPSVLPNPAMTRAAWLDVLDRARRVPGVQSVSLVDTVPMRRGDNVLGYWTTAAAPPLNEMPLVLTTSVTPDYFKVMGIPLLQGRFIDEHDGPSSEPVVVIDEVMARHAFGGSSAIGQRLSVQAMGPVRVIGVARHIRHWGLAADDQAKVRDQLYYAFSQVPDPLMRRWSELMSIAVRTDIPPLSVLEPLRQALRGPGNDQVVYAVNTMEQLAGDTLARQRFLLLLFGLFAALALLLASVGVYGVLAYVTGQRIPEIGVRMALGAGSGDVMRMVMRQSVAMIGSGAGIGLIAAFLAARGLERWVPGVRSADPLAFTLMLLVLLAAALFASFLPARRASRIDPLEALRRE